MKGEKVLGGTIKYAAHVMPLFMEGTTTNCFHSISAKSISSRAPKHVNWKMRVQFTELVFTGRKTVATD
jgi:hypothetical protein